MKPVALDHTAPARGWTAKEEAYVVASWQTRTYREMATALGRSYDSVRTWCRKRGLVGPAHQEWTKEQLATFREMVGKYTAREIAGRIGRTVQSVRQLQSRLKTGRTRIYHGAEFDAFIQEKNAAGWSDTQIADEYSKRLTFKVDRHTVGYRRAKLGLAKVLHSDHQRARVREKTKAQLRAAGLKSMAELRLKVWREHAQRLGWPDDLGPRYLQVLHALYTIGPMTRRELADAIGMPWKGPRKSLVSNDPQGSLLAHLAARGLVVSLGRVRKVTGQGRGESVCVYTLPLQVQPNPQTPAVAPAEVNRVA
jgi:transposase